MKRINLQRIVGRTLAEDVKNADGFVRTLFMGTSSQSALSLRLYDYLLRDDLITKHTVNNVI